MRAEQALKKLEAEKEGKATTAREKDEIVTQLNGKIKQMQGQIAQNEVCQKKVEELQRTIKTLQTEKSNVMEEMGRGKEALCKRIEGYTEREQILRSELKKKEEESAAAKKTIEEYATTKEKCTKLERENAELRKLGDEKKGEFMDIKEKSHKIQQRIDELKKIESDLRLEYNGVHQDKVKLQEKCKALEDQAVASKETCKKLQNAVGFEPLIRGNRIRRKNTRPRHRLRILRRSTRRPWESTKMS